LLQALDFNNKIAIFAPMVIKYCRCKLLSLRKIIPTGKVLKMFVLRVMLYDEQLAQDKGAVPLS